MLERRKGRGGGGGSGVDDWDAPPLVKAEMAFEIIWSCFVLYLISRLIKVMRNVPSRERQPYHLLLVSAIFLDMALIMNAIAIRIIDDLKFTSTYVALDSIFRTLYQQAPLLFTMAGLWVFRKRSKLIIYGKGARGIPYAGQTWKFVADWTVTSCSLLFLTLAVIVSGVGTSLYFSFDISYRHYLHFSDADRGLTYVRFAFYSILTIVFVVTGLTLTGAFNRQTGRSDVVTRQMLIWVMPWLIIRILFNVVDSIISGINRNNRRFDFLSLGLAEMIVEGACWTGILFGFIKTAADPGAWDWSHIQVQQPQIAQYGVRADPVQPSYDTSPVALPPQGQQGLWGQNNNPQQHTYQPYTPPHAQV